MTVLRAVRSLVLGETWELPLAVAALAGVAVTLHELAPHAWDAIGAPFLAVGVPGVFVLLVRRSASRR
jgi:hypothetical protein